MEGRGAARGLILCNRAVLCPGGGSALLSRGGTLVEPCGPARTNYWWLHRDIPSARCAASAAMRFWAFMYVQASHESSMVVSIIGVSGAFVSIVLWSAFRLGHSLVSVPMGWPCSGMHVACGMGNAEGMMKLPGQQLDCKAYTHKSLLRSSYRPFPVIGRLILSLLLLSCLLCAFPVTCLHVVKSSAIKPAPYGKGCGPLIEGWC